MKRIQTVLFNVAFIFFLFAGMLLDSSIAAAGVCYGAVGLCALGIALIERRMA